MQRIHTDDAPKAIGPYSQAVMAGDLLFVSGQLPIDRKVNKIVETTIEGQTLQILNNIEAILLAAGLSLNHVVRAEVYLKDLNDFQKMNGVYAEKFSGPIKPARQAFQISRLPLDALVEISCIASKLTH